MASSLEKLHLDCVSLTIYENITWNVVITLAELKIYVIYCFLLHPQGLRKEQEAGRSCITGDLDQPLSGGQWEHEACEIQIPGGPAGPL